MLIQVNSDNHIDLSATLISEVEQTLQDKLKRFGSRISRLEVQFTDENSAAKSGRSDKRCLLEARLNGLQPVVVTGTAAEVLPSLREATGKLQSLLDSTLGKRNATPHGTWEPKPPEALLPPS